VPTRVGVKYFKKYLIAIANTAIFLNTIAIKKINKLKAKTTTKEVYFIALQIL